MDAHAEFNRRIKRLEDAVIGFDPTANPNVVKRVGELEEKVALLEKKLSALENFVEAEYDDSPRYKKRSNKNEN